MNIDQIIQVLSVAIIPLLFAITAHEAAHGWVASKLGDSTALMLGRVTFNPFKHIDLFGTIILPIALLVLSSSILGGGFIFGYAKPVPVNWNNLRKPRRDMALVALAGPLTNLLMALIWAAIAKLTIVFLGGRLEGATVKDISSFLILASFYGIIINVILLVINLIPVPPLDGSRVVSSILKPAWSEVYNRLEPYGFFLILILIFFAYRYVVWPPVLYLVGLIKALFGLNVI